MGKIRNDEAMCVCAVTLDTYRVAADTTWVQNGRGINSNVDLIVLCLVKAFGLGCTLADVVYETI